MGPRVRRVHVGTSGRIRICQSCCTCTARGTGSPSRTADSNSNGATAARARDRRRQGSSGCVGRRQERERRRRKQRREQRRAGRERQRRAEAGFRRQDPKKAASGSGGTPAKASGGSLKRLRHGGGSHRHHRRSGPHQAAARQQEGPAPRPSLRRVTHGPPPFLGSWATWSGPRGVVLTTPDKTAAAQAANPAAAAASKNGGPRTREDLHARRRAAIIGLLAAQRFDFGARNAPALIIARASALPGWIAEFSAVGARPERRGVLRQRGESPRRARARVVDASCRATSKGGVGADDREAIFRVGCRRQRRRRGEEGRVAGDGQQRAGRVRQRQRRGGEHRSDWHRRSIGPRRGVGVGRKREKRTRHSRKDGRSQPSRQRATDPVKAPAVAPSPVARRVAPARGSGGRSGGGSGNGSGNLDTNGQSMCGASPPGGSGDGRRDPPRRFRRRRGRFR